MELAPTALIVSNLPILTAAAKSVLADHYQVVSRTCNGFVVAPVSSADLVIVDVTTADSRTALALVSQIEKCNRVVLCSLHENEVDVYEIGNEGLKNRGALPSLLDLVAV